MTAQVSDGEERPRAFDQFDALIVTEFLRDIRECVDYALNFMAEDGGPDVSAVEFELWGAHFQLVAAFGVIDGATRRGEAGRG